MNPDDPKVSEMVAAIGPENISREHALFLVARAISPEVAIQRGYKTIATPDDASFLRSKGFKDYQLRLPGIYIPCCGVDGRGRESGDLFRPDDPRKNDKGKDVKYERAPAKDGQQTNHIDVPRICQPDMGNPSKA